MRNLKKTLSLCLAFVMLIGLMAVGAGAASFNEYTDKDTIAAERQEAVDLLTALQIIGGTESGSFGPKENLQRDQAAKLVAWANLGIDANSQVSVNGNPFEDITPASEWANAYMVYCKNMGFINGINAAQTEFAPLEPVSGYQLAKMLLCVVGYGVNKEYVGVNWSMKVAVDAQTTGLNKGIENISNEPISREDAAQMVFNALTMEMVAYSELYGTYSSEYHNALNPTLLGTKAEQVFKVRTMENTDLDGVDYHYWRKIGTTTAITNSYDCDNIVAKDLTDANAAAEMVKYDYTPGVEIWENGVSVTARTYYLGNVKMEYYTTAPDGTCLYKPNFTASSKPITYKGQRISLVDEGVKCKYDTVYETGTNSWWLGGNGNSNSALNFWAGTGWGSSSTVRLQSNHTIPGGSNGAVDKIIVTTSYLAKMTGAKTGTMYVPSKDQKTFSITIDNPSEEYKSGDFVLVTPNMTLSDVVSNTNSTKGTLKIIADERAKSVDAANITSWSPNTNNQANGAVSTGGTNYSYNGVFANYVSYSIDTNTTTKNTASALLNTAGAMPQEVKTLTDTDKARGAYGEKYTRRTGDEYYNKGTYTLYLDQCGNVIGVEEKTAGIRDFAYIVEVGHDDFFYFTRVKALLSDGTLKTYYLDTGSDGYDDQGVDKNAGSTTAASFPIGNIGGANWQNDGAYVRPGEMYSYTVNGDYITLTDLDNSDRASVRDNSTYDAVEDVYDIRGFNSPFSNKEGEVERALYVEAKTGDGERNAFTSGGTSFIYTVKNNRNTADKTSLTRNVVEGTGKASIWGDGQHVVYATDTTVFTYVYGGNNDSTQIARYVGKNNAPTISPEDNYSVSMVLRKTGNTYYIEYVVLRGDKSPNAVWSNNYFTIVGNGPFAEGKDINGGTLYYYHTVKDGDNVNLALSRPGLTNGDVCTYTTPNTTLFTGDSTSNVETGVYTATKIANNNGVLYNIFADVDATAMVISSKGNNTAVTLNRDINFAGAKVWLITGNPSSAKLVEPGDEDYLRSTDTVTVVLARSTSSQQYNTAREVFITTRYDNRAMSEIDTTRSLTRDTYVEIDGGTGNWDRANLIIGDANTSAELYIDGNVAAGSTITVRNGKLTVSGTNSGTIMLTGGSNSTVEIKRVADVADMLRQLKAHATVGATVILGAKDDARTFIFNNSEEWVEQNVSGSNDAITTQSWKIVQTVNTANVHMTSITDHASGNEITAAKVGQVIDVALESTDATNPYEVNKAYRVTINGVGRDVECTVANQLVVPYTVTRTDITSDGLGSYECGLAITVGAATTVTYLDPQKDQIEIQFTPDTAGSSMPTLKVAAIPTQGVKDISMMWNATTVLPNRDYELSIVVMLDDGYRFPSAGYTVKVTNMATNETENCKVDVVTATTAGTVAHWSTKLGAPTIATGADAVDYVVGTVSNPSATGVNNITVVSKGDTNEIPWTNYMGVDGNWILVSVIGPTDSTGVTSHRAGSVAGLAGATVKNDPNSNMLIIPVNIAPTATADNELVFDVKFTGSNNLESATYTFQINVDQVVPGAAPAAE